ncbi:MAG: HEAT repeat domain-containing protein [Myxococcales bacterium]|nr:HEAT repeat domain-containing protein [Myxococcales bacterium]
MPALRDRTFNKEAWIRLALVALGLAGVGVVIYISVGVHTRLVEVPHLLSQRHTDPLGHPGRATTQIASLGGKAVDTLMLDLKPGQPAQKRAKSIEILSAIDDPRVVPALLDAMSDDDLGIRLAALAGLARVKGDDLTKHVWPLTAKGEAFFRHRAIVVLGLISDVGDVDKLLKAANETKGLDRLLLAWAAGYAQRRAKLVDPSSDRVRPIKFEDAAHERRVQTEVNELRATFKTTDVSRETALRLAELVTVNFGTWNLNHQISYQTIMVAGPLAVRGLARIERPKPPKPAKPAMIGLKLNNRPVSKDKPTKL